MNVEDFRLNLQMLWKVAVEDFTYLWTFDTRKALSQARTRDDLHILIEL